jgi:hypothetical protein
MNRLMAMFRKATGQDNRVQQNSRTEEITAAFERAERLEERIDRIYESRTGHPIGDVLEDRGPRRRVKPYDSTLMMKVR